MDLCEGIYDVTSFALNRAYKDVVKPLADIYNKASDIMDKIPTPVKIVAGLVGGAIAIGTGIAPAIVAGTMIKAAVSGAVISGAMYGVSSLFTGNFDKKEFVNSMLHGATDMFMISGVTLGVKGVVDCVARNSGRINSFLANESGEISVSKGGSNSRTVGKNQTTVYRVIRSDENPINGLSAKNPTRNMSVEGHIISGSRNKGSQYISTTTDINVAEYYASKDGCRIVEIDLNKLPSDVPIYDLSTDYGRNIYLKGITAQNFAKSSSEVLIEGYIPSEAIKLH